MVEEEPKKPAQDLEDMKLIAGDPTKVTKVGAGFDSALKDKIVEFLKQNLDIFIWTHENMPNNSDRALVECRPHQKARPIEVKSFFS